MPLFNFMYTTNRGKRQCRTWNTPDCIVCLIIAVLLVAALIANAQESILKKGWVGRLESGVTITEVDLAEILEAHKKWVLTKGKEGQRANLESAVLYAYGALGGANLRGADLTGANLRGANLTSNDLYGAILTDTDLRGAILTKANLSKANLRGARLHSAQLIETDLTSANLIHAQLNIAALFAADLRSANLRGSDLTGANANFADFSGSFFEPDEIDGLTILGAKGFSRIRFNKFQSVLELRKTVKEAGLRTQERALTAALRKYRFRGTAWSEWIFEYIFLDLPTDSGAHPWRCMKVLGFLIIIFSVIYAFMLRRRGVDGIWKIWNPERVRKDLGDKNPILLKPKLFKAIGYGFYFSLLSAFSIGWRDLNVGNWIARIQRREYTLRATGWARTISGIQSLFSVYLLALWVLTYFGRPFD